MEMARSDVHAAMAAWLDATERYHRHIATQWRRDLH